MILTYLCTVSATSNTVAGTEDVFVQLQNSTGGSQKHCRIRKVTIFCQAENSDAQTSIRFIRNSTAGSGGTAGTIFSKLVSSADSTSTLTMKDGVTNFTPGTLVDVVSQYSVNGRVKFIWSSAEYDDDIVIASGNYFCVMIKSSSASLLYYVQIEWDEPRYFSMSVSATSNSVADTEDTFLDFTVGAGADHFIRRYKVCPETATNAQIKIRLCEMSTSGTGSAAGTSVQRYSSFMGSSETKRIKNGTTNFTVGTVASVIDRAAITGRDIYEWIPTNDEENVYCAGNVTYAILITASQASIPIRVSVEWEM